MALPPGRSLPATDREWIVDGLVACMPGLRVRELFTLRQDMLTEADYIIVAVDQGRVVGLLTSRWVGLPAGMTCLHVMIQFIGDDFRHGPLFGESWTEHFTQVLADGRPFPDVVVLKTYNPVVHCAMNAFSGHPEIDMYPDLAGRDVPSAGLAADVAGTLAPDADFDPATGVLRAIGLPVDLYRERPMSGLPAANDYFTAHARPGDRVLCMLHVPTAGGKQAILDALGVPVPSGNNGRPHPA